MSRFWHIIGVWFVLQLVFLSAFGNMKSAHLYGIAVDRGIDPVAYYDAVGTSDCSDSNGFFGFLAGAMFPLEATNLVGGDWCWNVLHL